MEKNSRSRWLAIALGSLQIFIGLGAVAGGLVMMLDPSGSGMGFTIDLLQDSPFSSYLIPGLFLFLVNGVGSLLGSILTFIQYRYAGEIAIILGVIMITWIVIQVLIINYIHWMHPLYIGLGLLELFLGILLWKDIQKTQ
jgi:hypothetical protein